MGDAVVVSRTKGDDDEEDEDAAASSTAAAAHHNRRFHLSTGAYKACCEWLKLSRVISQQEK